MSSLTEHERVGLEDVFMCLGKKPSTSEKLSAYKSRLFSHLGCVIKKGVPIGFNYVKSKKTIFQAHKKVANIKIIKHFRPKNRDSK